MRSHVIGRRVDRVGSRTRTRHLLALLLICSAFGLLNTGCASYMNSGLSRTSNSVDSDDCFELLEEARSYVRSGQIGDGRLDWTIEELAYRCEREFDTFIDEVSAMEEPRADLEPLEEPPASGPQGSINWSEAINHVGSTRYVCGPLVNGGTSDDDVFLNLGRGYPDAERFTIVIWDIGGVEYIPEGVTLCTTGMITMYDGVAQIELRSANEVEVWE